MSEPDLQRLARYWALPDDDGQPVAYRGGNPVSRATFYHDLAAARQTLGALVPGDVEGRSGLSLFEPDAYCFAVWLLAAWSRGLTVVLPGDDLPATREALQIPWVGSTHPANALTAWDCAGEEVIAAGDVYEHPGVMLFTSGSTGQPSLVEKTLAQLCGEAEMFEKAFGGELSPTCRFVTSVPHQHMYGLPFFLLWSLSAARPFVVEKLRYPEDLARLPVADYVLISAPTFLKHLPDATPSGGSERRPPGVRWRMATSAGSPLDAEVARKGAAWLRAPLFEIYGSTETGAVARRQAGAPWQAMPGVRLSLEEGSGSTSRLLIHSPLLPEAGSGSESGFLSEDIARLDEHGLELLGRADRLVKVGEKRISLNQIEQELARLPEVAHARVLPLPHERESDRLILGAVIVLSSEGRAMFTDKAQKKAHFDAVLRNRLRARLDPLALPRRWRYVESLPCNEMGKTTRQDLERLFVPLLPYSERLSQTRSGSGANEEEKLRLKLRLPRNLRWFEGHFPGLPVLPGVVQVDWAAHFAHLYFGFDATAANLSTLKFQKIIQPDDALLLELVSRRGGREVEFVFSLDGDMCSRAVFTSRKQTSGTETRI